MTTQHEELCAEALGVIDALARAAHLWVRHLEPVTAAWRDRAHLAFVGGMISGLCAELRQPAGRETAVAYIYALLDGFGNDSLGHARSLLAAALDASYALEAARGRAEAAGVKAWLRLPAP